ncbi:MAG: hypothetical protein AAF628_07045 [Planctomycetota bacterium]
MARHGRPLALVAAMLAALFGAGASCLAPAQRETQWPPVDFHLEVVARQGSRELKRVRFFADGLVLYGEVTEWLDGDGLDVPVFGRLCAYQLRPKSIRQLSRLLERAGFYEILPADLVAAADVGATAVVGVRWRAFAEQRSLVAAASGGGGGLVRALHVINAFLPAGRGFRLAEMIGEVEPAHLVGVPAPEESLSGALDVHLDLVSTRPDDAGLLLHAFGLAIANDREPVAGELLDLLRAAVPSGDDSTALIRGLRALLSS